MELKKKSQYKEHDPGDQHHTAELATTHRPR